MPFAYVTDGTRMIDVGPNDIRFTPAERAAGRARVTQIKFPGYPIIIDEDTHFIRTTFTQAVPHTPIFEVRNGARLILEGVMAANVTLPDEMSPDDFTGYNVQGVDTPTGNPRRPTVKLFHECTTCACFIKVLRANLRTFMHANGRVLIARHKEAARVRRLDAVQASLDLADLVAENAAALAEHRL